MDERRKLERRHIMLYSRIFDRKTGKFLGYLGNLTTGGVMVISEEPIPKEANYKIRMELPDDVYQKPVLNFEARSIWCQADVDPNFYNTGFEFIQISPEDKEIIELVIQNYHFRDK